MRRWRILLRNLLGMRNPQTYKPVILITGCSSGIGLALARLLFDKTQYRVVATARPSSLGQTNPAGLANNDRFWILPLDVTDDRSREKLVADIEARWGRVDVLVNNAGVSYRAVVEHMDRATEQHQLEVNYLGPVELIRRVLPRMRDNGRGKIINVSSVSGMLAMPTMSAYSASKYALEGFSESLWYEMKPLGINVSLVQPGFIRSDSFRRVYFSKESKPEHREGPYVDYYASMEPFIERMMNGSWSTPETVARKILTIVQTENPPLWVPASIDATVFYYLRRLLPRRLLHPFLFSMLPQSRRWAQTYSRRRRQEA
jgi:NAD(P)-dependent dehydrogenase (short-subunit alcohol dehydrogenase family)